MVQTQAQQPWRTLRLEVSDTLGVAILFLNRPSRSNALDLSMFKELPQAISRLDANPSVRVIVLKASGKNFCSGIDLSILSTVQTQGVHNQALHSRDKDEEDEGRIRERSLRGIKALQDSFSCIESCRKPVIAAIHGACIGGGVDLITACDLRYCSVDALFSVKEVDLAIVADLGTLQRLPHLIGHGKAMELALTGKMFSASEAKSMGLVHDVLDTKEALEEHVNSIARAIAQKSPLAVVGTKRVLLKSRDLSVQDGLDFVATWNSAMLMSSDLKEAIAAQKAKRKPLFAKL